MTSTMNEMSKKDTTHISSCCMAEKRCNHIEVFKEFLGDLSTDCVTNGGSTEESKESVNVSCNGCSGGVELRPPILTRSNHESYPVTKEELEGEIIMCVWLWLRRKQCPEHFQIGVLISVSEKIKSDLSNKKIQEDLKPVTITNGEETLDVELFDLLKLQKFCYHQIQKFLLYLSDNSKEENLKNFSDCSREDLASYHCVQYAEAHIKNKPRKMEDRHICLPYFSQMYQIEKSFSFYGVCDGHSGSLSATYSTSQIPYLVAQELKSVHNSCSADNDIYRDALEMSFMHVDSKFCQKQLSSGTTAVCALLVKDTLQNLKHLYVAWVGDSKCLLVSPTVYLQLVKVHKPDSADERKRIESTETGGSVLFVQGQWRVNGIINVSRSIGDYTVKAVIAEPDIVDVPLQPSHDFLVLGSDGLWDHVSENEIVDCLYKGIIDGNQSLDDISKHLIELAKQGDSQDNITVVIVLLKDPRQIKEQFLKGLQIS